MQNLRLASYYMKGEVNQSLTPKLVMDFVSAFATFSRGSRVILGRDTRYSSPMFHRTALASLQGAGCDVLDFGICPTPIIQRLVAEHGACGAVVISGGHNRQGTNAIGLIGPDGAYLEPAGGQAVLDHFHSMDFLRADWKTVGQVETLDTATIGEHYFSALSNVVDVQAIRAKGLTVIIDPVAGAACPFLQPFADCMGFDLIPVNAQPSGYLPREPEPRPRSGKQLATLIERLKGDVGFLLSSDGCRVSIISESGEPVSEEFTFAITAQHVLSKSKGALVTNSCTSRTIDTIAENAGVELFKTRVGQSHISAKLLDESAILGGEGSGGVCLPEFSPGFDCFLVMSLVLEALALNPCSTSDLISQLPRYAMVKKTVPCGFRTAYAVLDGVKQYLCDEAEHIDHTDGLRVDYEDGWVHVRASKTEQLVRVISESSSQELALRRAEDLARFIEREA